MKTLIQLFTITAFLSGSYTTFHGHRLNKDCWLCQYRGIGWLISVSVILLNDYWEKQAQEKEAPHQSSYHSYPMRDFPTNERNWENTSDTGSDDSNDTIKDNQENK